MENIISNGTQIELVSNRILCFSGVIQSVNKDSGTYNVFCLTSSKTKEIHHNTIINKYTIL